ncbi:hypothetical protein ABCW43_28740 [Neorhizobium sp. IRAMC:178]|uniref:hypothetical protein n=1 Tax=Neorhizobium tunisiense TaxID=3144793 RepID=UPI0031F62222
MDLTENRIRLLGGRVSVDQAFIDNQIYLRDGDIAIAAGTLIEGIGNKFSDLDMYVFTEERRACEEVIYRQHHRVLSVERDILNETSRGKQVFLVHTVVPNSGVKVDVEFDTFAEVEALFDQVKTIYDYACNNLVLLTKVLTVRQQNLIHRLFNCLVLRNEPRFQQLMGGISRWQYCYVAYRWFASDFSVLLDLMGAWDKREIDRSVDLARENLIQQMSAYLHLVGSTNVRRKWLLTYLDQLPVPDAIRARFLNLFYMTGVSDHRSKEQFVFDTLDLVDDIQEASREKLLANPYFPAGRAALDTLHANCFGSAATSDYAETEYRYRSRVYEEGVKPTRLLLIDGI